MNSRSCFVVRDTTDEPLARITSEWVENKATEMFARVVVVRERKLERHSWNYSRTCLIGVLL